MTSPPSPLPSCQWLLSRCRGDKRNARPARIDSKLVRRWAKARPWCASPHGRPDPANFGCCSVKAIFPLQILKGNCKLLRPSEGRGEIVSAGEEKRESRVDPIMASGHRKITSYF